MSVFCQTPTLCVQFLYRMSVKMDLHKSKLIYLTRLFAKTADNAERNRNAKYEISKVGKTGVPHHTRSVGGVLILSREPVDG